MKGITLCADCAYYDLKKHKCNRGATVDPDMSKGQDVRFYVDCPLPDVKPVRHGRWKFESGDNKTTFDGWICTACNIGFHTNVPYFSEFKYCPMCGAKMNGGAVIGT